MFGSFFIGSAILHSQVPVSLGDRNVTRAVVGGGLYLTVLGLFALAIGAGHPAYRGRHHHGDRRGAGAADPAPALLPGSWGAHINAYLPDAGRAC